MNGINMNNLTRKLNKLALNRNLENNATLGNFERIRRRSARNDKVRSYLNPVKSFEELEQGKEYVGLDYDSWKSENGNSEKYPSGVPDNVKKERFLSSEPEKIDLGRLIKIDSRIYRANFENVFDKIVVITNPVGEGLVVTYNENGKNNRIILFTTKEPNNTSTAKGRKSRKTRRNLK